MGSQAPQDSFAYALSSNHAWAGYKSHQNPDFFPKLATGQSPSILWLGCSDSRVPETTLLGLQPGDVFVHRNIANIMSATDLSYNSVLEYAVAHLKVQHVVLCGHTTCGGCAAALGDNRVGGVLDAWLTPLRALKRENEAVLKECKGEGERTTRLAEINVRRGVSTILGNYIIEDAIAERGLKVHGVIYNIATGKLRDLGCGNGDEVEKALDGAADEKLEEEELVGGEEKEVRGHHGTLVFTDGKKVNMAVR